MDEEEDSDAIFQAMLDGAMQDEPSFKGKKSKKVEIENFIKAQPRNYDKPWLRDRNRKNNK